MKKVLTMKSYSNTFEFTLGFKLGFKLCNTYYTLITIMGFRIGILDWELI
jgi:hypothetical protein